MVETIVVGRMDPSGLQKRNNIWVLSKRHIRDLVLHIEEVALKCRDMKTYGGTGHVYRSSLVISLSLARPPEAWYFNDLKHRDHFFCVLS